MTEPRAWFFRGGARRSLALLLPVLALLVFMTACGDDEESSAGGGGDSSAASGDVSEVKVAVLDTTVGPCAGFDNPSRVGIEIAADQINKEPFEVAGKKYKVKLVIGDTKGDNTQGLTLVRGMIRDEGIKFFLNPICHATAMPGVSGLFEQSGVLAINNFGGPGLNEADPAKTIENVKGPYKNIFANTLGTRDQGIRDSWAMQIFPDKDKIKRVYILMQNDAGAKIIADGFAEGLKKQGMESETALYDPATKDFSGFLSKVKAWKPDVLVSGYLPDPSLAVLRQALQTNAAPRYYGFGQSIDDALKKAIGKPIPIPAVWDQHPVSVEYSEDPDVQELAKLYEAKTGELDPNASFSATSYDNLPMLVEAMKKAGSVDDPDKIARALEQVTYSGIFDNLHFDETHHLDTTTDGCYVEDGKVGPCKAQGLTGIKE